MSLPWFRSNSYYFGKIKGWTEIAGVDIAGVDNDGVILRGLF